MSEPPSSEHVYQEKRSQEDCGDTSPVSILSTRLVDTRQICLGEASRAPGVICRLTFEWYDRSGEGEIGDFKFDNLAVLPRARPGRGFSVKNHGRGVSLRGGWFGSRYQNVRLTATSDYDTQVVPAGSVTRRKACHACIPRCTFAHDPETLPVCAIVSRWGKRWIRKYVMIPTESGAVGKGRS